MNGRLRQAYEHQPEPESLMRKAGYYTPKSLTYAVYVHSLYISYIIQDCFYVREHNLLR